MRLGLFFFAAAAGLHRVLAITHYNGLVLTSIDVKDISDSERPGHCQFSGIIEGSGNDTTAVFLRNVTKVRSEGMPWNRRPIFEADVVPLSEVKKDVLTSHRKVGRLWSSNVGKPLLCVHGFNVQPEAHLAQCEEARKKFKKFMLIPVIWPSEGGIMNYFGDRRDNSRGAGNAFKSALRQYAGKFPRKSLIAHSMGNRVLRFAADPEFKFDNIFMVAADVNGDMFNKDYIENSEEVDRRDDGLKLGRMLASAKGKIYQLHNNNDYALTGSTITKFGTPRLGATTLEKSKLHDEVKEKIEGKDAGSWLRWTSRFCSHGYQWDDEAVDFYESKFYD